MNTILRTFVFTLFLFLGIHASKAQSTHNHAACGVSFENSLEIKARMLENRRNKAQLLLTFHQRNDTIYAPVVLHMVNRTDGTGGPTLQSALNFLCNINANYAGLKIQFYLHEPVRVINNTLLFEDGNTESAKYFMNMYKVQGPINVFFVQNTPGNGGYYLGGTQNDFICIPQYNMNHLEVGTHEFGHFFTLPHTFFGWEGQQYSDVVANANGRTPSFVASSRVEVENIARSGSMENCESAADGFCGTNPSYAFGGANPNSNNGCEYLGTAHDPYGYMFRPYFIADNASSFSMQEDNGALTNLFLQNNSTKDKIYPKTLIVVETGFTDNNGDYTTMWMDTIGNSDSTTIFCAANSSNDIISAALQTSNDVKYGFINMGNYVLNMNITSTEPSISFIAAAARFTVSGGSHLTEMDSIRVQNNSTTNTISSGTLINLEELLIDTAAGSTITSNSRSISLPSAIAPGAAYTFQAADLIHTATAIAGVNFEAKTYAPSSDTVHIDSDNYMSYFTYQGCIQDFTEDQKIAIQLDFAARSYTNLYPAPSNSNITDTATVINPIDNAVTPNPLINFVWNAVNGASMYRVHVYQINFLGLPVSNGDEYDFITTDTDTWLTLDPSLSYEWVVYPLNSTGFCNYSSKGSTKAQFTVNDWTINIDNINADINQSKLIPNPASSAQDILLEIDSKINSEAILSIYNGIGQLVMPDYRIQLTKGNNIKQLNTRMLQAGLYIVNIETKNGTVSHKLVLKD